MSDLFAMTGRHWLSRQALPHDERSAVQALLRQLDSHGEELATVDKEPAAGALATRRWRTSFFVPWVRR